MTKVVTRVFDWEDVRNWLEYKPPCLDIDNVIDQFRLMSIRMASWKYFKGMSSGWLELLWGAMKAYLVKDGAEYTQIIDGGIIHLPSDYNFKKLGYKAGSHDIERGEVIYEKLTPQGTARLYVKRGKEMTTVTYYVVAKPDVRVNNFKLKFPIGAVN